MSPNANNLTSNHAGANGEQMAASPHAHEQKD